MISTDDDSPERRYNVLVYGLDRKGLPAPPQPLADRNFTVHFEKYGTPRRFQEFDGVVLFQGSFETFRWSERGYGDSYLSHQYDQDELDKRKKETALLLQRGGFICFLLTEPFVDHDHGRDFSTTDLAKYELSYGSFYRNNFPKRIAHVNAVLDEFTRFLQLYGAANSHFESYNKGLDLRELAKVGSHVVGLILHGSEYFVPSLVPDARPEVIAEYFKLLLDAIIAVHNKLPQEVPDWAAAFGFEEEPALISDRAELLQKVSSIDDRLKQLTRYKAALIHSGPELVADVSPILEVVLGVKVDPIDEFREDIKLIGGDGKAIGLCEIKGINRGISREYINQADSHRERSGFPPTFPILLVANTNIKNARSIAEKDQEIDPEQIRHAVNLHVLIMRTIDLLALLRLVLGGKLTVDAARSLVLSSCGWLRVQTKEIRVLSGSES